MISTQKIKTFLWFDSQAEDAANYYIAASPDSRITHVVRYGDTGRGSKGQVMVVEFTLAGQPFMAISAGPLDPFNHAVSFMVDCADQSEVDHYWNKLLDGGAAEQCGWLRDRYGLCWQIVPAVLGKMMTDPDRERAKRVTEAMLQMVKFDIDALQRAYDGGPAASS